MAHPVRWILAFAISLIYRTLGVAQGGRRPALVAGQVSSGPSPDCRPARALVLNMSLAIIAALALSLAACSVSDAPLQTDGPPQVAAGTSKADVLETLGEPDSRETMVKQQESMWGPPEAWWHTLEMGDTVEIWSYLFPEGTLQLYFLQGSKTVDYQAFLDNDVVY